MKQSVLAFTHTFLISATLPSSVGSLLFQPTVPQRDPILPARKQSVFGFSRKLARSPYTFLISSPALGSKFSTLVPHGSAPANLEILDSSSHLVLLPPHDRRAFLHQSVVKPRPKSTPFRISGVKNTKTDQSSAPKFRPTSANLRSLPPRFSNSLAQQSTSWCSEIGPSPSSSKWFSHPLRCVIKSKS